MIPVTLAEIAAAIAGEIVQGEPGLTIRQVATDSRKIKPGDLFIALAGERYDGHQFLEQAVAAGAGALVVNRVVRPAAGVAVLKVADTLAALQALAAANRERRQLPLIGVTGSNGKTTVKDMIASILGQRWHTVKTPGNFNNEIGLPLTLLRIGPATEAAVVEMGMRGPGQISALCRLARPTGAVITNIGEAHLALLGNVSNIAAAKGEILEYIPAEGFAVLHAESPFMRREASRCRGKVIFFGLDRTSEFTAKDIIAENGGNRFTAVIEGDEWDMFLPLPGRHNVLNALAALAVARECGFSVPAAAAGLQAMELTGMRLEMISAGGIKVINDTYNASPASTGAALQTLKEVAGGRRAAAVLGDMLELGEGAARGHTAVGALAADLGLDYLVTVGALAAGIADGAAQAGMPACRIHRCADNQAAANLLDSVLQEGDVVLVKGSRGMHMEQIVEYIVNVQRQGTPAGGREPV